MMKLIQLEWLKNYSYKPVKIFSLIYFGFIILLVLLGTVKINIGSFEFNLKEQGIFNFPQLWNFITYIAALLKIFLGMIIIFTITHEFSNKLFKQNIIDGLSKKEYVASKVFTISILSFVSTLLVFGIGLILGYMYSEEVTTELMFQEIYFVFGYFLKLFTFFSFLFFLSVVFRKSIFVLLMFLIIWIMEFVLSTIEYFIVTGISDKEKVEAAMKGEVFYITEYLPLNAMYKLIIMPLQRTQIAKMLGESYIFEIPYGAIVACVIYSTIFILGSYYIIKKRDW